MIMILMATNQLANIINIIEPQLVLMLEIRMMMLVLVLMMDMVVV